VVLGRHVDSLEFLDILLGDRAPLTPVENVYQRMLAGDPDPGRTHAPPERGRAGPGAAAIVGHPGPGRIW